MSDFAGFSGKNRIVSILLLILFAFVLQGANVRRQARRSHGNIIPKGRPWYEQMFADKVLRIAVFWGWDHPRETIEGVFHAFETLNGKNVYYNGRKAVIEIGLITQIHRNPRGLFKAALEDPTIDIVLYSGHARFGAGPAFAHRDDIFRCGNGDYIEDRHSKPYRILEAIGDDLQNTRFPQTYRIVMLNCCDSEGHFRESWTERIRECAAPIDLVTVEYPVFNLYDDRRVLAFIKGILSLSDWKSIKERYDSEIHRRENRLVVKPIYVPDDADLLANESLQ